MSASTETVAATAEQTAAISATGLSIALASGAGCGKTTVLTQRFLALLEGEHRHPLTQLVALTFTTKAARELRDRIRREARNRAETGNDATYWRSIVRDLDSAKISTFHAYCGDVIRRYAIEAGIDPGYQILNEVIAPTVHEKTLETCLRRWLASQDADFAALAVDYSLTAVKEALAKVFSHRPTIDLVEWSNLSPVEVIERWEQFRDQNAGPLVRELAESQASTLEFLGSNECANAKMRSRCLRIIAELPYAHEAAKPLVVLEDLLGEAKVQGGGGKKDWETEEVYEKVKELLTDLRDAIKSLKKLYEPDAGRSLAAAESGIRFARLAKDALASFESVKTQEGMLDYNDLQLLVHRLLQDGPSSIIEELRNSISVLLVDEFQDTDSLQAEILEALAGADLLSGRLFFVGDAKQSIYGFRGAEPAIFDSFRERFPVAGRLNLTENYRSVPGILEFVNVLFGSTFPGEENTLRAGGSHRKHALTRPPEVEFLWAAAGPKEVVEIRRKAEADSVARLLSERLQAGWLVRDRVTKELRRATPADVAILFRSRADFPTYQRAFDMVSLNYHVVGGSSFYAQQEVIDLLNLVSTIEDPLDPLALAGLLRGPFFGVSDEGLYWLSTAQNGDLCTSFAMLDGVVDNLAPDDRVAVLRASESLTRWRGWKDDVAIAELLDRALGESGFEAAVLGEFLGSKKRVNIRKLVDMARQFDEQSSFTLADFVERLRADVKTPPREEEASTTDESGQAVRYMTIHQSKGLEFPIVVLADLDRKPHNDSDLVQLHPDLGFLLREVDDVEDDVVKPRSLGRELAKTMRKRTEHAEDLRVFYVATTRARDHLILSAGSAPNEPPSSAAMKLLAERFDRATGKCLVEIAEGGIAPKIGVIELSQFVPSRKPRPSKDRPKLLLTANRILREKLADHDDLRESIEIHRARCDLDSHRLLSPTLERVDRLFRSILFGSEAMDDTEIEQAASRLGMIVSNRIRDLVGARFRSWKSLPIQDEIGTADTVRKDLSWALSWPLDQPDSTVYRGRVDIAFRDPIGSWHLLRAVVDTDANVVQRERVNLLLASYALDARGIGPVVSASLAHLGGEPTIERMTDFDVATVSQAIETLRNMNT